jgi:hypothetical protein
VSRISTKCGSLDVSKPYGLSWHVTQIASLIQFNSIYLCAKLNSSEANYKVSTGKKMGRVRSKKESENNVLIKIKIIKYKMTMSTILLLLIDIT